MTWLDTNTPDFRNNTTHICPNKKFGIYFKIVFDYKNAGWVPTFEISYWGNIGISLKNILLNLEEDVF